MRVVVDFTHVAAHHRQIDERLTNWARWVIPRPTSWIAPMWRGFKSSEIWATDPSVSIPIDSLDAQAVEKQVSALPEKNRDAIRWAYVFRGHPSKMCRELGVTRDALADLIYTGRSMLINRIG